MANGSSGIFTGCFRILLDLLALVCIVYSSDTESMSLFPNSLAFSEASSCASDVGFTLAVVGDLCSDVC